VSAGVVSRLRARPGVVRLMDGTPADNSIIVRAQVAEVWDAVRIEAPSSVTVLEVKRRALAELLRDDSNAHEFVVKVRGQEVLDESVSLAAAGVRDGSTLLITSRRRHPVH
jgi:type VII secretion system (Wss) protein YukD